MDAKKFKKSEQGMATVETVTLLFIFTIFMSFFVGVFGVIHTGILNSISARAYAFETYSHRANVTYFRHTGETAENFNNIGFRLNTIISEKGDDQTFVASTRKLSSIDDYQDFVGTKQSEHYKLTEIKPIEQRVANPVWIKTGYGICIDSECGG